MFKQMTCEFLVGQEMECGKPAIHFINVPLPGGGTVFPADDPLAYCAEHFQVMAEKMCPGTLELKSFGPPQGGQA
jgi:hypothetical protein